MSVAVLTTEKSYGHNFSRIFELSNILEQTISTLLPSLSYTSDISTYIRYDGLTPSPSAYTIMEASVDCEGDVMTYADVKSNIEKLLAIGKLDSDWNGYGAKDFPKQLVDKCINIIQNLSVQPEIYPTGRQSIQMQYELEDKSYLEFEVYTDKTESLLVPQRIYNQASSTTLLENESEEIKRMVDQFYAR